MKDSVVLADELTMMYLSGKKFDKPEDIAECYLSSYSAIISAMSRVHQEKPVKLFSAQSLQS